MKLLIATANKHKLVEIRDILQVPGLELVGLDSLNPAAPEVIEDGDTFVENAVKKAVTTAMFAGLWTLADDSGLEVEALDGAPGVYSARYAGEPVDYKANNAKLLRELAGKTNRRAAFRCVIALSSPNGRAQIVEGRCAGQILKEERGVNGFGYDPLFVADGCDGTFAEMPNDQKNRISHRHAALMAAVETWGEALKAGQTPWR